jgi:hypothetical protein
MNTSKRPFGNRSGTLAGAIFAGALLTVRAEALASGFTLRQLPDRIVVDADGGPFFHQGDAKAAVLAEHYRDYVTGR